jgi:hypothetical protein
MCALFGFRFSVHTAYDTSLLAAEIANPPLSWRMFAFS